MGRIASQDMLRSSCNQADFALFG